MLTELPPNRLVPACRALVAICALVLSSSGFAVTIHTTQSPSGGLPSYPGTDACELLPGGRCLAYELGMQFQSSIDGYITAIRYWRANSEPFADNSHLGWIWAANGSPLASVIFTDETIGSGWQEQLLAVPLSILANTTYTVSVNVLSHFVYTSQGLNAGITNGPLTGLAGSALGNCSGSGTANGVFSDPGTFPISSFNCNDYFRDVQFMSSMPESVVPVPAAAWLLTSAFGALGWLRRKQPAV